MKRTLSAILAVLTLFAFQPLTFAAVRQQNPGEIAGTAVIEGKPLASITVRLRNTDTRQLVGETQTSATGAFRFTGLPAGNYVIETVARDGATILGTTPRIALVAGGMTATGLTVSTSAAAAAAAGLTGAGAAGAGAAGAGAAGAGAAGAGAGAGAGGAAGAGAGAAGTAGAAAAGGAFFATTAGIITAVAVGAGVTAGIVVAKHNASPSS